MNKLDLKLLRRAIAIARPFWAAADKRKARWVLVLLVVLLVVDTQINVFFNAQAGEFTSALAARNAPRFWHSIRAFLALPGLAVPVYACYYYVRDRLALDWRRWLTDRYLDRYFGNHAFYHLLSKPEIDNPDQRIADDVASFTQQSLGFLLLLVSGVFQLVAFSGVLWSISSYLVLFLVLYQPVAEVTRAARHRPGRIAEHLKQSPVGLRRHGATCFVAAPVRWPASNAALRLAFGPVAPATLPTPLLPRAAMRWWAR